jgi:transposase
MAPRIWRPRAGLCPGNHESAGRQRNGKTRKGNVWLKAAMVTAAIAAARTRRSYYAEKYRRLSSRRGKMRAAVAVAHKILVAAYHMLANRSDYRELGPDYLDRLHHHRTAINLTNRLRAMGYDVQITARAQ